MIEIKELINYLPEHKELIISNGLPKYQYGKVFFSMNNSREVHFLFDRASEVHGVIDIGENLPPEVMPFKTTTNNIMIAPIYTPDESGMYYLLDFFSDVNDFGYKLIDILEDAQWVSEYYGRIAFFKKMGLAFDSEENYLEQKPKHEHEQEILRGQLDERADPFFFMTSQTDLNWTYIQRKNNLDQVPEIVKYITLKQEKDEKADFFNKQFIKLWTTLSETEKFKLCAELLKNIQPRKRISSIIEKILDREKMGSKSNLIILMTDQEDFKFKDFKDTYGMYILQETDYDVNLHMKYGMNKNSRGIRVLETINIGKAKHNNNEYEYEYRYYIIWYKQKAYKCFPLKFNNNACGVIYIMSLLVRYYNANVAPSFIVKENKEAFMRIYQMCYDPKEIKGVEKNGLTEYDTMISGDKPRLVSRYYKIENVLNILFRDFIGEDVSPFITNQFTPLAINKSNIILPENLLKLYPLIKTKKEETKEAKTN